MVVLFGKAVFVKIKIQFKQCIQFVFSYLAYHFIGLHIFDIRIKRL